MWKFLAYLCFLLSLAVAAAWYSQRDGSVQTPAMAPAAGAEHAWLDQLYSGNPRKAEAATRHVASLGPAALSAIRETLRDPSADRERRRAALKACMVLGHTAAPVVPEVAASLTDPELTPEAALALSFMGPEAFPFLRRALTHDDENVRQEALRSIGKLRTRAPLEAQVVVPLLVAGMRDRDPGVRAVAATYLGILEEHPPSAVPALIRGLADPDVEVRVASATALGSFGDAAKPALPALRQAAADRDHDVAREAGRTIVRLQGRS